MPDPVTPVVAAPLAGLPAANLVEQSTALDLSLVGMFMHADFVVKLIVLGLLGVSVWCWAIIIRKITLFRQFQQETKQFEDKFWSGGSLEDLYDSVGHTPTTPIAAVFSAAMREWQRSYRDGEPKNTFSLEQRIERAMQVTMDRELDQMERHVSFLASVGSSAPFIGLFGMVWGMMNSFKSVALTENTSLAVVAPGIAEALAATAIGLIAAIPAVLAYNRFSNSLARFESILANFSSELMAIISRQLDRRN